MTTYTIPLTTALLIFPLLAIPFTLPWLIYNYRKYGFLSWSYSLVVYSFMFYMLAALFLVVLPLPVLRDTCSVQPPGTVYYSLIPFTFIKDAQKDSRAILQAAFNFVLLLPFGVYMRYFFPHRFSWIQVLGLGFALSLFYEVTQATAIYGFYTCPYRIFDVDDLLLNSTGALLGFYLAPIALSLFPSPQSLLAKRDTLLQQGVVSPVAQLIALAVDMIAVQIVKPFVGLALVFQPVWRSEWVYTLFGFLIVFFVVPVLWKGKTPGTALLRIRLRPDEGDAPLPVSLLTRTIALYLPTLITLVPAALSSVAPAPENLFYIPFVFGQVGVLLGVLLMWGVLFLHGLLVLWKRGTRPFYFDDAAHLVPQKL